MKYCPTWTKEVAGNPPANGCPTYARHAKPLSEAPPPDLIRRIRPPEIPPRTAYTRF